MSDYYYFMSVGEKSYFYTLNYSYIDMLYTQNEAGNVDATPIRKYSFIRNLSHDFDEAVEKAKEWHKAANDNTPLKLLSSPKAMSERDMSEYIKRMERIKSGIFNKGKYADQHVSEVPKSYVYWYLCNMYVPELSEDDQNLNAQICYNYADEQGWIDEWAAKGKAELFPQGYEEYLNNIIVSDEMLVGKFQGAPFEDFCFTKKKTVRMAVYTSLLWYTNQEIVTDKVIKKFSLKPELAEDGEEYYTITSEQYFSCSECKPTDFELSVLIARNFLNPHHPKKPYPKYRFKWSEMQMPVHRLIAYCPRSEVE